MENHAEKVLKKELEPESKAILRDYFVCVFFIVVMTALALYGLSMDREWKAGSEIQSEFVVLYDALENVRVSFEPQLGIIRQLYARGMSPGEAMELVASEFVAANELVSEYVVRDVSSGKTVGLQSAKYITETGFVDTRGRESHNNTPVSKLELPEGGQNWISAIDAGAGNTFYMLASPLYIDGDYQGYIGLLVDTEVLEKRYLRQEGGLTLLTDRFGNVLQRSGVGPKADQIIHQSNLNLGSSFKTKLDDKSWLCTYQNLPTGGAVFHVSMLPSGMPVIVLILFAGLVSVLLAGLGLYYKKLAGIRFPRGNGSSFVWVVVALSLTVPLILHLLAGGFGGQPIIAAAAPFSGAVVCMPIALATALVWLNRCAARRVAYLYTLLMLGGLCAEIFVWNSGLAVWTMALFVMLLLTGLAAFAVLEIHITRLTERCGELELEASQLKSTQSLLVQREKMGTLGQLIAGIAHEINTPIGAIKASSESLSAAMLPVGTKLMEGGRSMSKDDQLVFYTLVNMAMVAINEMKSTVELRRSKAQLRAYLESMQIERRDEILELLARLEICEVEKVETNLDLFRKDNIVEILKLVNTMTPFITGTQTILFATGRVSKIVFALKSYAHTSSTSGFTEFDIIANIENVLVLCHNQIKKGITLIREIDDLPNIRGNPDEMGQVWTNLLQNSIYAMNECGTLTITAKKLNDDRISVTIADTGMGIKKESLDKIFQPLYTTKPLGEGSGLGLDICRKIVESHSGTISAVSELGVGSAFTVELPVNAEDPK